ncbi:MAG: 4Fe-4S dicluster domain-containing protein [Planctomycetota bacterium]|nr:4Fe-4S dicluster domain-containing protein [Planctomycetota bacterium]
MRIANVRVVSQVFFLLLFFACLYMATAPRISGFPTSIFLEADPLVAVAVTMATGQLYHIGATGLALGVILLVATMILGRIFCGWICPMGTLQHFVHWLGFSRTAKARLEGNAYRKWYWLKYVILIGFLVAAAFQILQIGLLDPIALISRSFTDAIFPVIDHGLRLLGLGGIAPSQTPVYAGAWFIGIVFAAFLLMSLVIPRFFCRALCPLGALMGVFSRFAVWRIHRDPGTCTGCNLCLKGCEGASDPHATLRLSECMVCMNCVEDCPHGSISFKFLPPQESAKPWPDLSGRRAVLAGLGGAILFPSVRRAGATVPLSGTPGWIRPPGSHPEADFLARCIKCDACIHSCPTNVLQPAGLEAGFEGLWTPILDMRVGYCDITCTLCGYVCPTGAIQRLTPDQRAGEAERPDGTDGPVQIGTASYDRGRCLPWAMDTPCVVCEEVCPTSPKAIWNKKETVVGRDGQERVMQRPYVDPKLCVGCGICEHECPIRGPAAIRVGSYIGTV